MSDPIDAAATTCRKPAHELVPVQRVAPRFPIDGPRAGYVRDGDLVVFDLDVDASGRPTRIDLVCTTASEAVVRVARSAIQRSRFAPADAPYGGRISMSFRLSADPLVTSGGNDD